MICEAWRTKCQKCRYRFPKGGEVTVCPNCGTPREHCKNEAVEGYKHCGSHGGPNPKNNYYGNQSVVNTSGKESGLALTRVASKYIEMKGDGRLLSNRASIEVVRDRIRQLAERIDLNQAPDRLANLKKLWDDCKYHRGQPDEKIYMDYMDEEFERAYHDYASWRQMFEAIDLDRKLVESEVKIIKDIKAVLTAEDAYELTAQLLAAIITTVNAAEDIPDKAKLYIMKRIQYEFTRIVGGQSAHGVGRSSPDDCDAESSPVD